MDVHALLRDSEPFLSYLTEWEAGLAPLHLADLAPDPSRAAILSVDVINGFCTIGPLASPRIQGIVAPIASLFTRAYALGWRNFVLVQDTHVPDAVEFAQYPPHCIRGTAESESVPEFKALPFYAEMAVVAKNSIHPGLNTTFDAWLAAHPQVDTYLCVGDCTDLCTYQLAMHVRLRANAHQLRQRVIVPANCTETFDIPVEAARQIGAVPHAGDLLHLIFLYSMRLNGVEVVRAVV
jgi:nicotinamidase-related amidase